MATMFPQRREAITDKVVAQPQNWGVQAPAQNEELVGLVRGLSELNPALNQYAQSQMQLDQIATDKQRATIAALAQQQSDALDMQGKRAIEFAGQPTPAEVPPALGTFYRESFFKALGEREGIKTRDEGMQAYNEVKDKPDFNIEGFLGEYRTKALTGLEGAPVLAAQVGNQVNALEVQLRADSQRQAMLKHAESRNASIAQSFTDGLRADQSPQQQYEAFLTLRTTAEGLGSSKKEAAQFLLARITDLSTRKGGDPAAYDVFDMKDAEGVTLANRNPELASSIMSARQAADGLAKRAHVEASQKGNFEMLASLDKKLAEDPASITLDVIKAHMNGPASPFPTDNAALAFYSKAQRAVEERKGTEALRSNWANGTMYLLSNENQQKVAASEMAPHIQRLTEAAAKGDVPQVTYLAEAMMKAQSATGMKAPLAALEQFINTSVTSLPGKAPSVAFRSAAALYKAYSTDPAFREIYFKGDTAELMRAYDAAEVNGDPQSAYEAAYASISPAAKAAAAKMVDTPEFKAKQAGLVKSVAGRSMWPRFLGGDGTPTNAGLLGTSASGAVRDFMVRKPTATEAEVQEYAEAFVSKNFVHDTFTNTVVQVPPNFAGERTSKAISAYSERVTKQFRSNLAESERDDWKMSIVPEGTTGMVRVEMWNGMDVKHLPRTTLQDIEKAHLEEKLFTSSAERKVLEGLRQQRIIGTIDPAFVEANSEAILKAQRLGLLSDQQNRMIGNVRASRLKAEIDSISKMDLGPVDNSQLQFVPQRGAKVDNKLTAQTASGFMKQGVLAGADPYHALAGSLITMAEGTVLQSYPDPAQGAGNNIGMGYNLKANAKNAADDLQRAGVPAEKVQAVIDGTAQLLPEQARRLLLVAMPRYTAEARKGAEATQAGLWDKMSPQQRAVMTDIAYSVGSTDQFKKAWAAMAAGDSEAFKAAVMTTYVNRSGERVQDVRRFNLRASMLAGTPSWSATIVKYGGYASNQMDSIALNASKGQ